MKRITRRNGLSTALLLLLPAPLRAAVEGERPLPLFPNPAAPRTIGAAYLRARPTDALADVRATACLPRPEIAARVRDDFAAGRVVMLDGWMLSVTEARLCALALRDA